MGEENVVCKGTLPGRNGVTATIEVKFDRFLLRIFKYDMPEDWALAKTVPACKRLATNYASKRFEWTKVETK